MSDATLADERNPDRSTCRNCSTEEHPVPIIWDDYSYVHMNGMADCNILVTGGTTVAEEVTDSPIALSMMHIAEDVAKKHGVLLVWEPTITATEPKQTTAQPIEWGPVE